jgi:hypothetical protein
MWELYEGYVDVQANNEEQAIIQAKRRLATGTFRDRGFDAWVVDKIERRHNAN